jgi:signal peptidase II
MKSKKIHIIPFAVISFLLLITDYVVKYFIRTKMQVGDSITVIKGFFRISYVQNKGAVFGILQNNVIVFSVLTVIAIAIIVALFATKKITNNFYAFSLLLILSGAVGNFLDRIFLGYVVDMIDFYGIWPFVFNIADCCVVIGVLIIIFYEILGLFTKKSED